MTADAWDVIVIGAGPAGTTAASLVAREGHSVLILEKRSGIRGVRAGSVTTPAAAAVLEQLGILSEAKALGHAPEPKLRLLKRNGATDLEFNWAWCKQPNLAWTAPRAELERLILERALADGAELRLESEVLNLVWNREGDVIGVRVQNEQGEEQLLGAKLILDASGIEALGAVEKSWRLRDLWLDQMAIWNEFSLGKAGMAEPPGTSVLAQGRDKNWFWFQRIGENQASVGLVGERTKLFGDTQQWPETFAEQLEACPWLRKRLRDAKPEGSFRANAGFSGRSMFCGTDGLLMLGDAYGFIDPFPFVGFTFALESGAAAAEAALAGFRQPELTRQAAIAYGKRMRSRLEPVWRLCYAFYREGFSLGKFLRQHESAHRELEAVLAGEANAEDREFQRLLATELHLPTPLHFALPVFAYQIGENNKKAEAATRRT